MIDRPYREEPEEYGPVRASEKTWRERIIGAAVGVVLTVAVSFFGAWSRGAPPAEAAKDAVEAGRVEAGRQIRDIIQEEIRLHELQQASGVSSSAPEQELITRQTDRIADLEAALVEAADAIEAKEEDRVEAWILNDQLRRERDEAVRLEAELRQRLVRMEDQNADQVCFARDEWAAAQRGDLGRLCSAQ